MEHFSWNYDKNIKLKKERDVRFGDVIFKINSGEILDIIDNPNKGKYPNRQVFILKINEYIYYVPFVEDENEVFLKTIIPIRKLMKEYSGGNKK